MGTDKSSQANRSFSPFLIGLSSVANLIFQPFSLPMAGSSEYQLNTRNTLRACLVELHLKVILCGR
uniref:Uncharacterized protein n=1 Tax=Arundo donax TaxID=35708 RepID=A0A0A9HDB7_ARUDO